MKKGIGRNNGPNFLCVRPQWLHYLIGEGFDGDAARRAVDAVKADGELINALFKEPDGLFLAIGRRTRDGKVSDQLIRN